MTGAVVLCFKKFLFRFATAQIVELHYCEMAVDFPVTIHEGVSYCLRSIHERVRNTARGTFSCLFLIWCGVSPVPSNAGNCDPFVSIRDQSGICSFLRASGYQRGTLTQVTCTSGSAVYQVAVENCNRGTSLQLAEERNDFSPTRTNQATSIHNQSKKQKFRNVSNSATGIECCSQFQ